MKSLFIAFIDIIIGIALGVIVSTYIHREDLDKVQMATMVEIQRQCESPYPLLLGNKFYKCYPTGRVLNDRP